MYATIDKVTLLTEADAGVLLPISCHSTSLFLKAKTIAEQMANRVHAKLGYRPPTEEEKQAAQAQDEPTFNGDLFKRYEVDLEINDFPQTARWKVTSKVSVIPNRKLNSSNLS